MRTDKHNSEEQVTVLVNVSNEEQEVAIDVRNNQKTMRDLISGQQLEVRDKKVNTTLKPYAAAWLK